MVSNFLKSWWTYSTNYCFGVSPSSENVIKVADLVVSPAVNMYQGGITVKYKAAYFLALEAESAASLIVIPALKKATVLSSVQQIYLGAAVLVGVIAFAMLVFYGGTPPPGGGRLLDSPVSSVTSTSCGSTVNIEVQSSLPHSVIDTSTAVSADAVTTVLADVEGLSLSMQPLIDQALLAEPALTGIVDSALFGTSLVVASAAALTTSVLPEVVAATLPLVPLVNTELGFLFVTMKNLQITILKNYSQYDGLNSNGAPPLTDTLKFLSKPHMVIMRDQLLRMGYDLTEYYAKVQPLQDGAAKEKLGFFIVDTLHNMLKTAADDFSNVRDNNTPSLYNKTTRTVYKHLVNVVQNLDIDLLNTFPRRRP